MRWSTSSLYRRTLIGLVIVTVSAVYFIPWTLEGNAVHASPNGESFHFPFGACGCSRNLTRVEPDVSFLSTCGVSATLRGPFQKVVAYSFYGNRSHRRNYFSGISANAEIIKKLYPGWVMRVYHAENDASSLCSLYSLFCRYEHLDLCHVSQIAGVPDLSEGQGNMWRFLPLADVSVDVFVSRDLDSRPSPREVVAVNEWLSSNKTFHVMRDHPRHTNAILAGMWGAKVHRRRTLLRALLQKMLVLGQKSKHKGFDQDALKLTLWPHVKGDVLQHDSYTCKKFAEEGGWRPWPSRRKNGLYNFVGSIFNDTGVHVHIDTQCPLECRPPNHKSWTTC